MNTDSDLIRAEGEGMLSSEAPRAQQPHVARLDLLRAHGSAYVRRLRHVELPVLRSRALAQIINRPFTTIALAVCAGIGIGVGALLLARKSTSES